MNVCTKCKKDCKKEYPVCYPCYLEVGDFRKNLEFFKNNGDNINNRYKVKFSCLKCMNKFSDYCIFCCPIINSVFKTNLKGNTNCFYIPCLNIFKHKVQSKMLKGNDLIRYHIDNCHITGFNPKYNEENHLKLLEVLDAEGQV